MENGNEVLADDDVIVEMANNLNRERERTRKLRRIIIQQADLLGTLSAGNKQKDGQIKILEEQLTQYSYEISELHERLYEDD